MNVLSLFAVILLVAQAPVPVPGQVAAASNKRADKLTKKSRTEKAVTLQQTALVEVIRGEIAKWSSDKQKEDDKVRPVAITSLPPLEIVKATGFNWANFASYLLVLVVFAGIVTALKTISYLKKQAVEMSSQRGVMQGTLTAIKRQADLFELKERARVRVDMGRVEWSRGVVEVIFNVVSEGPTPAFIQDSWITGMVSNTDEAMYPTVHLPMGISDVVREGTKEMSAYVVNRTAFSEEDICYFHKQKLFVHVSGRIDYKDIFGNERVTAFTRVCKTTDYVQLDGSIHQYWLNIGKDEDNQAT